MEPYVYQQVDPSTSEIRLLELAPGSWDDDIKSELRHALLSEEYEVVSYTWGEARDNSQSRDRNSPPSSYRNMSNFVGGCFAYQS
jgi:hypothetical protein